MANDLMELVDACEPANYQKDERAIEALKKADELTALGLLDVAEKIRAKAVLKDRLGRIAEAKYPVITPDKIREFLRRKVEEYNKEHEVTSDVKIYMDEFTSAIDYRAILNNPMFNYDRALQRMILDPLMQTFHPVGSTGHRAGNVSGAAQALGPAGAFAMGSNWDAFGTTAAPSPDETFSEHTCDYTSSKEGTIGKYVWTETTIERYAGIPPAHALKRLAEEKLKNVFDYFTIASVNAVRDPLLLGRLKDRRERYFLAQWGDDVSLDDVI